MQAALIRPQRPAGHTNSLCTMIVNSWSASCAKTLAVFGRRVAGATVPKAASLARGPRAVASLTRSSLAVGRSPLAASAHAARPLLRRAFVTSATAAVEAAPAADMATEKPREIFRKDYKPTPYLVDTIHLNFVLNEDVTRVESTLRLKPNYTGERPDLFLHGREDVELVSVKANGQALSAEQYNRQPTSLTISGAALPEGEFKLEIVTAIKPQDNSLLEGLYKSGGMFCTQCEAEGFRGITFFADRPDVMAKYTTRVEADKAHYPVLLSNGNLVDSGELPGGRHFTVWEDPFRKPCYLFALVAGDLALSEDSYTTASGKTVALRIWVHQNDLGKVAHAMESLKRSMKWDEEVYGLEYDLDLFNVVAVADFNMGAMENKSLNIFNSRLVLATPDQATDLDFARIEGVVGHEYFHNWTGNRVTCRDWFQLTLKEGLTVYRDQEFSADMNSRPVKRIEDVIRLRAAQLPEDAGPLAHPIRPDSYIKMDNFYTSTVYEKGAEVIRLYEQVLGKEGFRRGMDLYFQRHDGQAVTCDDFLAAMADANSEDLSALARWYGQAGTPELAVSTSYNPSDKTFTIRAKQRTPATPGQPTKQPVLIPIRMGLLGPDGKELLLRLRGSDKDLGTETVLRLTEEEQEFVFEGVEGRPVPSLLRGYSAPVKLTVEGQTDDDLEFLLAHDTDAFNRWEAGQVLSKKLMVHLYQAAVDKSKGSCAQERMAAAGGVSEVHIRAIKSLLEDPHFDGSFKAMAITLPSDSELIDAVPGTVEPLAIHEVREFVAREVASRLRPEFEAAVKANDAPAGEAYVYNAAACARRAIKNRALGYLSHLKDEAVTQDLLHRFRSATNMTDEIAALAFLDVVGGDARETGLAEFFEKWKHEPLVILKWITIQASSNQPGNLDKVKALVESPAFQITNPNNCYSLFLAFARSPVNFHASDGSGYQFLADSVLRVDKINRQVASRMVGCFSQWRHYDEERQVMMKAQLERIVAQQATNEGLSENVFEVASKSLGV